MRRDNLLLEDFRRHLDTITELGFTAICLWGLAASRDWPLDLASAFTPEKREFAARLRTWTRERGLQLLAGTGVFSWGFEEIIKANPHLGPTNLRAMCAHQSESWDWMHRVIDVLFQNLELDGVQMQSADLGRCECQVCLKWNALEHHAILNARVAQYIRQNWPQKTIGVNGWGMDFSRPADLEKALPLWKEMGEKIDYFTGIDEASSHGAARQVLIDNLACAVGTIGGAQVEPPQHWERERWFLPLAKRTGEHLRALADAGGRSCEAFYQIDVNPGDEISLWVRGLALQNPFDEAQNHLRRAVVRLYKPRNESATEALCELFARAEEAYFGRAQNLPCGTFSLEPLVSGEVGPPIYLDRLKGADRALYRADLLELAPQFLALKSEVEAPQKLEAIARCLHNAAADAAH